MRSAVWLVLLLYVPEGARVAAGQVPRVAELQPFPGGALKEEISVRVENVTILLQQAKAANTKPVLFLNGQEMVNIFGTLRRSPDAAGTGTLSFFLDRDASNREAWKGLLYRPPLHPRKVTLSTGVHGELPIPTNWVDFQLTVIHIPWLVAWAILFLFVISVFLWKAATTPLLREEGAREGQLAAFSLARCQMAWWFFLVLAAYLLLYMVTWDFDTITAGTLGLIGISAATGLAAAVVDSSKKSQLLAEQEQLRTEQNATPPPGDDRAGRIRSRLEAITKELAPTPHTDFLTDILHDSDGISFHRFQMVVWTIVLGVVFAISVYTDLMMPDFSATLLGLMGISSGTYVGFKFPETKA